MAIKGLTDRNMAFPEIGQIRKGMKETRTRKDGSTYEVPVDLDYFKVDFDEREQAAQKRFEEVYGKEPKLIRVVLPFNEIEKMWDPYLEAYTAGRMIGRSDGEHVIYQVDGSNGELLVLNGKHVVTGEAVPHPTDNVAGKDYQGKPVVFAPVGRLKVIIPELERAVYLVVLTGSQHDIANISDQLRAFQVLNGGVIAGIPFVLRRRPKKISVPKGNGGQRVRMTKHLISIEADPEWVRKKLSQIHHAALPGNGFDLLPAGESEAEEEVIESECHYFDDEPADEAPVETAAKDPEPASEKTPAAKKNGNGKKQETLEELTELANSDPSTAFWKLANKLGMSTEEGLSIVNECKNNMVKAFEALAKQAPPEEA